MGAVVMIESIGRVQRAAAPAGMGSSLVEHGLAADGGRDEPASGSVDNPVPPDEAQPGDRHG